MAAVRFACHLLGIVLQTVYFDAESRHLKSPSISSDSPQFLYTLPSWMLAGLPPALSVGLLALIPRVQSVPIEIPSLASVFLA